MKQEKLMQLNKLTHKSEEKMLKYQGEETVSEENRCDSAKKIEKERETVTEVDIKTPNREFVASKEKVEGFGEKSPVKVQDSNRDKTGVILVDENSFFKIQWKDCRSISSYVDKISTFFAMVLDVVITENTCGEVVFQFPSKSVVDEVLGVLSEEATNTLDKLEAN